MKKKTKQMYVLEREADREWVGRGVMGGGLLCILSAGVCSAEKTFSFDLRNTKGTLFFKQVNTKTQKDLSIYKMPPKIPNFTFHSRMQPLLKDSQLQFPKACPTLISKLSVAHIHLFNDKF